MIDCIRPAPTNFVRCAWETVSEGGVPANILGRCARGREMRDCMTACADELCTLRTG